jgi:hypothetical protein
MRDGLPGVVTQMARHVSPTRMTETKGRNRGSTRGSVAHPSSIPRTSEATARVSMRMLSVHPTRHGRANAPTRRKAMPLFDAAKRSLLKKIRRHDKHSTERSYHDTAPQRPIATGASPCPRAPQSASHAHHHRHCKQPHAAAAPTAVGGDTPVTARVKAKFSEVHLRLTALEEGYRHAAAVRPLDVNSSRPSRSQSSLIDIQADDFRPTRCISDRNSFVCEST